MFTESSGYVSASRSILKGELTVGAFMAIGFTMLRRYQHRITVQADSMVTCSEIFIIACCKLLASIIMGCRSFVRNGRW